MVRAKPLPGVPSLGETENDLNMQCVFATVPIRPLFAIPIHQKTNIIKSLIEHLDQLMLIISKHTCCKLDHQFFTLTFAVEIDCNAMEVYSPTKCEETCLKNKQITPPRGEQCNCVLKNCVKIMT